MLRFNSKISWLTAAAAGLVIVAAGAQKQDAGSAGPAPSAQIEPQDVVVVGAARTGGRVTLGGVIVPYKSVTLNAEVPGVIRDIAGKEGDRFEESVALVQIDDDQLRAKRQEVLAQIQIAESNMRNAGVQYQRTMANPNWQGDQMLGGFPSMFSFFTDPVRSFSGRGDPDLEKYSNVYSSRAQVEQAQAQILQAKAQLAQLEEQIDSARAVAPFTGVILQKMVERGDTVQPGQPLVQFADLDRLQMQIDVPARLVAGLEMGMVLPAKLDVGGVRLEVRVAQIFPSADLQRHSVTVKLDLPQNTPAAPGMYAEVMVPDINASTASYPTIPTHTLLWRGTLPAVFVLNEQNEPELRVVRVGELVDSAHVTVLSGLNVGERILSKPTATGWTSGTKGGRFAPSSSNQ